MDYEQILYEVSEGVALVTLNRPEKLNAMTKAMWRRLGEVMIALCADEGLRCVVLRWPYGDQGLLIPRRLYDEVGGYRSLAVMEDIDLTRRLGARRLKILRARAVTSAQRYQSEGYVQRAFRNQMCLLMYALNVPAARILQIYGENGQKP